MLSLIKNILFKNQENTSLDNITLDIRMRHILKQLQIDNNKSFTISKTFVNIISIYFKNFQGIVINEENVKKQYWDFFVKDSNLKEFLSENNLLNGKTYKHALNHLIDSYFYVGLKIYASEISKKIDDFMLKAGSNIFHADIGYFRNPDPDKTSFSLYTSLDNHFKNSIILLYKDDEDDYFLLSSKLDLIENFKRKRLISQIDFNFVNKIEINKEKDKAIIFVDDKDEKNFFNIPKEGYVKILDNNLTLDLILNIYTFDDLITPKYVFNICRRLIKEINFDDCSFDKTEYGSNLCNMYNIIKISLVYRKIKIQFSNNQTYQNSLYIFNRLYKSK